MKLPSAGWTRDPKAPMRAEDVVELLDRVEADGVRAWVDGGWGVDALLEQQTREHDDLDLVVPFEDRDALERVLRDAGFAYAEGRPANPVWHDARGRQVDVHYVELTASGDGVYTMETGDVWLYPARGFEGHGRVGGRDVRCLTPEVQVLCHAGYELDDDDCADLRALRERFGVDLPADV